MSNTTHHRNQKKRHNGCDLWNKRPLSGEARTTENKDLSRRLERSRAKQKLRNADDWNDV
jgi:hypothetical protein